MPLSASKHPAMPQQEMAILPYYSERIANNGFGCEVRRRKAGKLSLHCTGGRNSHAPRQGQAYYSGSYPVSSGKPWRADWLRASSSQRSFSACPLCPRTHSSVTLWRSSWTWRRSQRSRFLTGFLAAVFQPFFRQPASHFFSTAWRRYCESVYSEAKNIQLPS